MYIFLSQDVLSLETLSAEDQRGLQPAHTFTFFYSKVGILFGPRLILISKWNISYHCKEYFTNEPSRQVIYCYYNLCL